LDGEQKRQIEGSIIQTVFAKDKHSMLLVDDLYDSGATLTECVNVLRQDKNIDKIYVLTMTKTKG
jgi:predicted amidophosphoribosyltransferase